MSQVQGPHTYMRSLFGSRLNFKFGRVETRAPALAETYAQKPAAPNLGKLLLDLERDLPSVPLRSS